MSWFIGMAIGSAITLLIVWTRGKGIKVKWYEYLIAVVALLLGMLSVQHFTGSGLEDERKAGLMGFLIMGGLAIVAALTVYRLVLSRYKSSS